MESKLKYERVLAIIPNLIYKFMKVKSVSSRGIFKHLKVEDKKKQTDGGKRKIKMAQNFTYALIFAFFS